MEKNKNVHAFLGPHCNAYVETVTTLSVRTFYVHAVIQFFFIGVQILTWCTRLSIVTSAKLFHHRHELPQLEKRRSYRLQEQSTTTTPINELKQ